MRHSAVHLVFVAAVLVSAALSPACKGDKEGGSCVAGQAVCSAAKGALTCGADGKFRSETCKGPKGCAENGGTIQCDNTFADLQDGCDEEGDVACATDKKSGLACHAGKFALDDTCKGVKGCAIADAKLTCDNDVADVNDACHFEGDYACTPDKLFALKCVNHTMQKLNSCRGGSGCRIVDMPEEHKIQVDCDDSVALAADPCDEEGEDACSQDARALLVCRSHVFTVGKACTGAGGCTYDASAKSFKCDTPALVATSASAAPSPAHGAAPRPHKPALHR